MLKVGQHWKVRINKEVYHVEIIELLDNTRVRIKYSDNKIGLSEISNIIWLQQL